MIYVYIYIYVCIYHILYIYIHTDVCHVRCPEGPGAACRGATTANTVGPGAWGPGGERAGKWYPRSIVQI